MVKDYIPTGSKTLRHLRDRVRRYEAKRLDLVYFTIHQGVIYEFIGYNTLGVPYARRFYKLSNVAASYWSDVPLKIGNSKPKALPDDFVWPILGSNWLSVVELREKHGLLTARQFYNRFDPDK